MSHVQSVRSHHERAHRSLASGSDCTNLDPSGRPWGGNWYFNDVASRWHACRVHEADLQSGLRVSFPQLPIIDDEYVEHARDARLE